MAHVSYSDLRQNLAQHMDDVLDSNAPLVVTRQGKRNLVLLPEDEFEGMQETLHLLRSPANARRLLRSVRSADAGKVVEHSLVEERGPATRPADAGKPAGRRSVRKRVPS